MRTVWASMSFISRLSVGKQTLDVGKFRDFDNDAEVTFTDPSLAQDTTLEFVGRRIREERQRRQLSLDEVAQSVGVDKSQLSRISP